MMLYLVVLTEDRLVTDRQMDTKLWHILC